MVPAGGEALREIQPGVRVLAVNGRKVESWDDVQQGIANAPEEEVRLELSDGSSAVLPIHPDALEERLKASQALQPLRPAVVGQVVSGRPAARAGFQPGDTIVSIGDRPVQQWYDVLEVLQASAGKPLEIGLAREDQRLTVRVTPDAETVREPNGASREVGRIGVAVATSFRSEQLGLGAAIVEGGRATMGASTQIFRTVRGLFSGRINRREVGGPILIGQLAGESARMGLDAFLAFMALISINLAILNLLPIPVLDGGQFIFLLAEALIRRPLPLKLRERLTAVGLVLIVLLMGLAFSNDIRRLVGG
jgi:regulator of sigma E protease